MTLGNVAASGFVYVRIPRFDPPEIDHADEKNGNNNEEKEEGDETDCEQDPLISITEARRRRRSTLVEQGLLRDFHSIKRFWAIKQFSIMLPHDHQTWD